MQSTPSFRLTAPAAPAWDAEQRSLFSAGGLPIASPTAAASLRSRVMDAFRRQLKNSTALVEVPGEFVRGPQRPAQLYRAAPNLEF